MLIPYWNVVANVIVADISVWNVAPGFLMTCKLEDLPGYIIIVDGANKLRLCRIHRYTNCTYVM